MNNVEKSQMDFAYDTSRKLNLWFSLDFKKKYNAPKI